MANFFAQDDTQVDPEGGGQASGNFFDTDEVTPQSETPQEPEAPADVSVTVQPEIMDSPEAAQIIEGLQQQFGGAAPIFAPGDEREAVWDAYQEQLGATAAVGQQQPDEGKRLIPGDVPNAILAGGVDMGRATLEFAGDALAPILPSQGEAFKNLAGMIPEVKTDGFAGDITRTITRYIGGAIGAGKIKWLAEAGPVVAGAVGDFVVTGSKDKGISEMGAEGLIDVYPALEGPILEYMADPEKDVNVKRFIGALEGVLMTKTAMAVFKYVKGLTGATDVTPGEIADAVTKAADDSPVDEVHSVLQPGDTVKAADQGNVGTVLHTDADNITVKFKSPETGATATKTFPRNELENLTNTDKVVADAVPINTVKAIELPPETQKIYLNALDDVDLTGDLPPLPEGTLNWSKMDSEVEVQNTWNTLTDVISGHLKGITGGVRTFKQETDLAESLAEEIGAKSFRDVLGPLAAMSDDATKITGRLIAAKQISQSLAREVHQLSTKIQNGVASTADEVELLRRIDLLTEFTGMVKGAQTAAARMTSAGRIRTGDAFNTDELIKLVDEVGGGSENVKAIAKRIAATGGETRQIHDALNKGLLGKAVDIHNEIFISGILGGVKTHAVNLTSNLINTFVRPASKILGGALTGQSEIYKEGFSQYTGMALSIKDSLKMAGRAWKMEQNVLDLGNKTQDHMNFAISASDGKLNGVEWDNLLSGDMTASWKLAVNAFGKFVRMPSRFLMAEDEFFKQLNYRGHVYAQANRKAISKGIDPTDPKYVEEVQKYFNKQFDETGRANNKSALRWSQESTFTNDLKIDTWGNKKSLSESLQTFGGEHPFLRGTVMPFIRTPANIMRTSMDMGPAALLRKQFYTDFAAGGERRAMAIGKASTGSMMWMGAVGLAYEGKITGAGPQDPKAKAEWKAAGMLPYSFKVGDNWVSYHRLDPFASILGIAADYHALSDVMDQEVMDSMAADMSIGYGEALWKKAGIVGTTLVSNIAGKSYLQGLTEVMGLISSGSMNKERMVARAMNSRLAAYIPSYAQMYTADPEVKDIRTAMDALMSRSPWHSEQVEAKRDYLGEKIMKVNGGVGSQTNPFAYKTIVRQEVKRLGGMRGQGLFSKIPEKSGSIDLTEFKSSTGQSAYDRLQELIGTLKNSRGETLEKKLERRISSDSYNRRTDPNTAFSENKKIEMLTDVRNQFKERAMRKMLKEKDFRKLGDALKLDKRNQKRQALRGLEALIN